MSGRSLLARRPSQKHRVLLLILDGWGLGGADSSNPIFLSHTPTWDALVRRSPKVHPDYSELLRLLGDRKPRVFAAHSEGKNPERLVGALRESGVPTVAPSVPSTWAL